MRHLSFTLLSDGSSDRALLPLLRWVLRQGSSRDFQEQWANLAMLRNPPRGLGDRIRTALQLFPCDLLFVHRDAEGMGYEARASEIRRDLGSPPVHPAVCVVPIRMQEAWLLFDEAALRRAADNPRGQMSLALPSLARVEEVADPKQLLLELLEKASGLRPGRLHRFRPHARIHRLVELIEDFAPLRQLFAFRRLEEDVKALLQERGWE